LSAKPYFKKIIGENQSGLVNKNTLPWIEEGAKKHLTQSITYLNRKETVAGFCGARNDGSSRLQQE
jgi:hypothetical protein